MAYKAIFNGFGVGGPLNNQVSPNFDVVDMATNLIVYQLGLDMTFPAVPSTANLNAAIVASLVQWGIDNSVTIGASDVTGLLGDAAAAAASSYQTIVSQTGTSAPAVSGSFSPMSSYPAGTTFTWARTSAGLYTLTASTAVFSTSKTGVFVEPLQNLNAQARGVVTSSTVVTFTTAIGSLLGLGLLGLTATPTDALLNGTMIYVQTY